MILPAALSRGETVAVVAPSSPFEHVLGWRGLGWLATRYRLRFTRSLFTRTGYLAGDDARRRAELQAALDSSEVRAILAARGGYGASRFVHDIDWSGFLRHPKWIVGFSDVTALHVEAAGLGVASVHGCHLTAIGRSHARAREGLSSILEHPTAPRTFSGLTTVTSGEATGVLFGGNLTLLHACAAAGRLRVPPGAILFIEDVTERPYRIDRMLTTLALGGHLAGVRGIALGDFTSCDPLGDGVTVESVVNDRLGGLGIPVVAGVPAGHGIRNEPLVLGLGARIDADPSKAAATLALGVQL